MLVTDDGIVRLANELPSLFIGQKKSFFPPRQTHIDLMAAKQACKLATPTTRVHTSKGCPLVRTVWGYLQLLTWTLVSCRAEWYLHSIDSNPINWSSSLLLDTLALAPLWSIFLLPVFFFSFSMAICGCRFLKNYKIQKRSAAGVFSQNQMKYEVTTALLINTTVMYNNVR